MPEDAASRVHNLTSTDSGDLAGNTVTVILCVKSCYLLPCHNQLIVVVPGSVCQYVHVAALHQTCLPCKSIDFQQSRFAACYKPADSMRRLSARLCTCGHVTERKVWIAQVSICHTANTLLVQALTVEQSCYCT